MDLKYLEKKEDFLGLINELTSVCSSKENKFKINLKNEFIPIEQNDSELEKILKEKNIDSVSLTTKTDKLIIFFPECKYQIEGKTLYFKHPYVKKAYEVSLE